MSALTRNQILGADDRQRVPFDVPEWGGTVYLSELSAADFIFWQSNNPGDDGAKQAEWVASIVLRSVVDEFGDRLFSDDDVTALQERNHTVLMRLFRECLKLNGGSSEEVEKNSESSPESDSSSS